MAVGNHLGSSRSKTPHGRREKGKGKIKAWRNYVFKKQVKRIKMGRKVISSLVQFGSFDGVRGASSPAPGRMSWFLMKTIGGFPRTSQSAGLIWGDLHIALASYASFDGLFSLHPPCQLKIRSDTVQAVKQPGKGQTAVKGANFN